MILFGFPVELTEEVAEDEGLKVDHAGFETEMEAQRERARSARSKETSMGVQSALLTDIKVESKFVGYTELTHDSELFVIIQGDALVNEASAGTAELIFAETPFYAEMGGQIADRGYVKKYRRGRRCQRGGCEKKHQTVNFLHKVEVFGAISRRSNLSIASGRTDADTYF